MRLGQAAFRWAGVPLLSCALVALLPVPAASGRDAGLPGRPAEALAEPDGRGPRAAGPTGLPLRQLFGHRDQRVAEHWSDVAHGFRAEAESDEPAFRDDPAGPPEVPAAHPAAADDPGPTDVRAAPSPQPPVPPRTDARDGPGGDGPAVDGSGGDGAPAPVPAASPAPPEERVPPVEAGPVRLWSPAPVAPEDAGGAVAGGAEPAPWKAPPAEPGAGSRDGVDLPAEAAPAAAQAPAGAVRPVLSLGAGLASLGLGLAFLALRMRRG